MQDDFKALKNLIDCIQMLYSEFTEAWCRDTDYRVNLKHSLVSDIEADGEIYRSIMEYTSLLNERNARFSSRIFSVCNCSVSSRVKTRNSIEYKLQNYKTEKHEFGRVPVNKCFNDLFGVRVFLDTRATFDDIRSLIELSYKGKYRCIDSSKGDYKAVHIYFKESNQAFPWELQIWNKCDVERNFASHKEYKQAYTIWEEENKKGGTVYD